MKENKYIHKETFQLELGKTLPELEITYHTAGELNIDASNVIWVCHALTANSNVADWWPGMFGEGKLFDPKKYFIICANILGSCYGTTGPLNENPQTGLPYFLDFPSFTVRDIVNAHDILRQHLGVDKIHTLVGGSIGGQQALEWSIIKPEITQHLIFIASGAKSTPWLIAFNESQRMAIESDPSFLREEPTGGLEGMKTARSIALLTYRNAVTYNTSQKEVNNEKTGNYKASSYQRYQGEKLAKRFNAYTYHYLSKAVDSHNVGRKRANVVNALKIVKAKTLLLGIDTDILFPAQDIKAMEMHIANAEYHEIKSTYGHDGFLLENNQLTQFIQKFYNHA